MNKNGDHIFKKCRRCFGMLKKSYHRFSLNNLMKIESLEFKLYFDGVLFLFFLFFFLAILAKYFSRSKSFTANKRWPVVLTKSIIFSGNSIRFLDFSYLLSIFFLLDDAFISPAPIVFPTALQKQQFRLLRCLSVNFCCKS